MHDELAKRPAAVADHIDGDGGDASRRQHRSHDPRCALLAVREAVAEERHRPTGRGFDAGRNEQGELQLISALRLGYPEERAYGGDKLIGGLVVGRRILAESHLSDRSRNDIERRGWHRSGAERGCRTDLPDEVDSRNARYRKHRTHRSAGRHADHEVGGSRSGGLDLVADLLQVGSDALSRENAQAHDPRTAQSCRRYRIDQRSAIGFGFLILATAETQVVMEAAETPGLDRIAGSILNTVGDDERIARMLVEQLVRFEDQRLKRRIPLDLVDAYPLAEAVQGQRVAQIQQIDRVAVDRGDVDRTGERHGDARLQVKAIEGIDDIDIGAVGG